MMAGWSEQDLELGDVKLHLWRGGRGRPVLVLHHDIGTLDRLPFYDSLAEQFDVLVPHLPGWGKSERPEWLRHPRDMAAMAAWLLADLGVTEVNLVGLGFGFVPYALLAVPRPQRRLAAATLGIAAIFSTLVTLDQAVLPISIQPTDRLAFYDRVWGVDPANHMCTLL